MSSDDYAQAIIAEGKSARKTGGPLDHQVITPRGIQIALATALVESNLVMYANRGDPESLNYPHEALSTDANSVGLFQQRAPWWGTVADRMDPARSAALFYHALERLNYNGPDSPGSYAQAVQQSAFPDRYDQRFGEAVDLYNRLGTGVPAPAYSERAQWSPNSSGRGGNHPTLFLLHTQEGAGDAGSLANFLGNPNSQVSYHYTVDNGVNVVDVVDTDLESWSVLDANAYSINLCFAGSTVNWSRQQWLDLMGNGIRVAAWLAVQDCRKYNIPTDVIPPPYHAGSGISDHRYVTRQLGIGTHVDVGDNFPWDFFIDCVNEYTGQAGGFLMALNDDEQRELLNKTREVWDQLRGFNGQGWPQLGQDGSGNNLTPVDALAAVKKKVGA